MRKIIATGFATEPAAAALVDHLRKVYPDATEWGVYPCCYGTASFEVSCDPQGVEVGLTMGLIADGFKAGALAGVEAARTHLEKFKCIL